MRRSLLALVVLAAAALLVGPDPASGVLQEPDFVTEAWFQRTRPRPPQADLPDNPATGGGAVSPGPGVPPNPAPEGTFVVASAGGQRGADQGDTAWTAFEWDVLAALDGSVEEFVVTLTKAPDGRGDFGEPQVIACNVVVAWAGAPAPNPWVDKPPIDCAQAVAPEVGQSGGNTTFTFDLTPFGTAWAEGKGYGAAFVPGVAGSDDTLTPFQLSFAGYSSAVGDAVKPKVTFRFTPGQNELGDTTTTPLDAPVDSPSIGADESGGLTEAPGIEEIPTDAGSDTGAETGGGEQAAGGGSVEQPATVPTGSSGGFPGIILLLLPLAALAFWSTGTALGPAGEMTAGRQGGVSRVLAQRRAARAAGELGDIDRSGGTTQ